jgi:tRNA pseudouridine32 synthase/23S rRNA pseudouridine746 synthase
MTRNKPVPHLSDEDRDFVRGLLIHEDDQILVFNKPPGLAVQIAGGRGRSLDFLLWAFARSNGKRPRLVHRIDTGTTGVLIVARTKPAAAHLSAQFSERRASKTYRLLVGGAVPNEDEGIIETPLLKVPSDRGGREKMIAAQQGLEGALSAETGWTILARNGPYAFIEARPVTGRMHQIRAHMAALGCPILGDRIYGTGQLSATRLMLHAACLEITHPDGQALKLEAPLPEDFKTQAEALGVSLAD